MKDNIFWPERSAAEVTKLQQEAVDFFESVIKRGQSVDCIFWPDLDAEETERLYQEGQAFFEAVMRRKK